MNLQFFIVKSNFKKNDSDNTNSDNNTNSENDISKEFTESEFEEFVVKSGAKGSFMIYRSTNKDDELGLDEL